MRSRIHMRRGVGALEVCTAVNDMLLDPLSGMKNILPQLLEVTQTVLFH